MQTRAPNHRAAQPTSRTADRASRLRQRPASVGRPRPAIPRDRRYDAQSRRSRRRPGPNPGSGRLERSAPPIGLVLGGMSGKRHPLPARSSGRSACGLLSVFVLLAFACFPVFAQADSSGVQYSDAPPDPYGGNHPTTQHDPPAKSSTTSGGASAPDQSGSTRSGSSESSSSDDQSSGGVAAKGNDGGTGQGSPGKGSSGKGAGSVQQTNQPAPKTSSSDGGSSPLIPILIAIAVLAALSAAAVTMRNKRQGKPGAPVYAEGRLADVEKEEGNDEAAACLDDGDSGHRRGFDGLRIGCAGSTRQLLGRRPSGDSKHRAVPATEARGS